MEPRLAIDGPGWSVSFQRRVAAANRGALPYVPLDSAADRIRLLVPLRSDEALWIAVMAEPSIAVEGRAGASPLRALNLSDTSDGRALIALDAIGRDDQWLPIDATSIAIADDIAATATDAITLTLSQPNHVARRIGIVAATSALYESRGGLPAPRPTTEQDQFRGWRLP